jgi:hypothetical protein
MHTDAHANRYANSDSNNHSHSNCDTYCNANSNTQCYANSHTYAYSQANADCQALRNTEAAAHPAAAALAFIDEKEVRCSTPTSGREHARNFSVRLLSSRYLNLPGTLLRNGNACLRNHHNSHQHKRQRPRFVAPGAG